MDVYIVGCLNKTHVDGLPLVKGEVRKVKLTQEVKNMLKNKQVKECKDWREGDE